MDKILPLTACHIFKVPMVTCKSGVSKPGSEPTCCVYIHHEMKVLLLSIVFVCAILPSIESSEYHGSNAIGHVNNKVYRPRGEVYNRGNLRDELRELQTTLYKIGERIKEFVKNNFNGVYNTMIAVMKAVEKVFQRMLKDVQSRLDKHY
ncbi:hypothetical protein J6590_086463 [Homalodisca vitripennis]|nr:hypothetical protein J6590_086463 [Homalodisca vitripennis]